LISPHYFPEWALNKWPHLRNGGGGFLTFIPDEKEAKQVVEDYLRIVIPIFRDKPALNTICLSNEPELRDTARATNTRPMWNAYLSKVHGNTETANKLYGTSYKSFDDVPIPGNNDYAAPQFYDWCSFNNERFAAWHKWMADIIHEMAPGVPVHAKVMSTAFFQDHPAVGTDRELFAELGQLNGNDCYFQGAGASGWAVPWQFMAISYDLQRSVARKPIFNSENHLTPDFNTIYVSPDHYRTALWQGAVHGQGITTIWCWERVDDPGNCLYGLVMDRPGCAEAVGKVNLDLNRFADEVAAIQNEKSPVDILYSTTSFAKDQGFTDACRQVHPGLSFHGFKVDFITEKQLQAGKGKEYKLIVFPQTTHVLPETFKAVKALPESVKLAFYGDCLSQDPYGNPMPADELKSLQDRALTISKPQGWNFGFDMPSELEKLGALPEVRVVDALTGKPIWGLEWIPAKIGNRTVISIINLRNVDMHVKILLNGKRVDAKDLLSLGGKDLVRLIKPITPVLAELSQD
jgi:hypothetical protein